MYGSSKDLDLVQQQDYNLVFASHEYKIIKHQSVKLKYE
jgi:hypothetical protein